MITTRKKQSFGIAAVELGAPVSAVPSIPVCYTHLTLQTKLEV